MLPKCFSIFMMLRNSHRNWKVNCGKHFTNTTKSLTFKRSPIFVICFDVGFFFEIFSHVETQTEQTIELLSSKSATPTTIHNLPSPGKWTDIIILHLCWLICLHLFITWLLSVVMTSTPGPSTSSRRRRLLCESSPSVTSFSSRFVWFNQQHWFYDYADLHVFLTLFLSMVLF